jgi:hypothetical protein
LRFGAYVLFTVITHCHRALALILMYTTLFIYCIDNNIYYVYNASTIRVNLIADTCALKKACSAGVSTPCTTPENLKPSRESLWTPWGLARSKPGAYMHPIVADVARKRRSAFWRCRRHFCVFSLVFCGGGGVGAVCVRYRPWAVAGGLQGPWNRVVVVGHPRDLPLLEHLAQ